MNTPGPMRAGFLAASLLAAVVALAWSERSHDHGDLTDADLAAAATPAQVEKAAGLRIFFAHQSVGGNLVDGLPGAFRTTDVRPPPVIELSGTPAVPPDLRDASGAGVFSHVVIGQNGDPLGKIRDFDAWVRAGIGEHVDVAMLKLCYVDVTAGTDVLAVFESYRDTIDALARDYPDVTFVPVTTPLTTEPGLRSRIKGLLGAADPRPADNAARQRFNTMLRSTYGERVFDLASVESTAPDGDRITGVSAGEDYFALYDGFAVDEGHLDRLASEVLAARLLGFLAGQVA